MKLVIVFLLFFSLAYPSLAAAGLILPPVEAREFYFTPEAEYEWTWHIHRAESMTTWLTGDLAQYAELDDPGQGDGERDVTFRLSLPEELSPGLHTLTLNAREEIDESAGVQARAAVGGQIRIISLYPEPWVQARMEVSDTPENTTTTVDIQLLSWSEVDTTVYADIQVFDGTGAEVLSLRSDTITVPSQERVTLSTLLPTQDFSPGSYSVKALLKGSTEGIALETSFRIGILEVYLGKYTDTLPTKSINRFEIEAISRWTNKIENVYADITFAGMTERTPTIFILPGDGGKLHTFFDMRDMVNDTIVEGNVRIYYEGRSSEFPITINVTNQLHPRNERPGFVFELTALTGVYLLLLLLVIINVVVLLRRKK